MTKMPKQYLRKSKIILSRILGTFLSFPFWILTVLGNSLILSMAFGLYLLEGPAGILVNNPAITNYFDTVWWAFSTVTTVGYGDIVPMTQWGKIIGIFLMLFGTGDQSFEKAPERIKSPGT